MEQLGVANSNDRTESIVLLFTIGLACALKNKAIDIETSEKLLFSPRTIATLTKHKASQGIIDVIHMGTELEDIASLLPEKLNKNLEDLLVKATELLSEKPPINDSRIDWYDDLLRK